MSHLSILIPAEDQALCPICGSVLLGQVIRVYGGVIFCARCVDGYPYFILNRVIRRCRNPEFRDFFVAYSGLLLLAPKKHVSARELDGLFTFETTDVQYDYPQFIGIVSDSFFGGNPDPVRSVEDPRHPAHVPNPLPPPSETE